MAPQLRDLGERLRRTWLVRHAGLWVGRALALRFRFTALRLWSLSLGFRESRVLLWVLGLWGWSLSSCLILRVIFESTEKTARPAALSNAAKKAQGPINSSEAFLEDSCMLIWRLRVHVATCMFVGIPTYTRPTAYTHITTTYILLCSSSFRLTKLIPEDPYG